MAAVDLWATGSMVHTEKMHPGERSCGCHRQGEEYPSRLRVALGDGSGPLGRGQTQDAPALGIGEGATRLGSVSNMGQSDIRKLLTIGAMKLIDELVVDGHQLTASVKRDGHRHAADEAKLPKQPAPPWSGPMPG